MIRSDRTRQWRQPRSWLYVPGDRDRAIRRATQRGADAVILDLEDGVAPDRKDDARRLVREALPSLTDGDASVWVRVDATSIAMDVAAVAQPALDGVVLAKADLDGLERLDRALATAETNCRVDPFPVVAVIETARGLASVEAIARAPRVVGLAVGEADLTADLGVDPDDAVAVSVLRMALVVAAAAVDLPGPSGPVATDYRDLPALEASTRALVRQGFRSRPAIHPAQVATINDVLTPTAEEVARARHELAAFEAAGGGATAADGVMVDAATVRRARDVLTRARGATGES
jgi:citrate lyase subunit beta/citryl-CoA lyase